MLTVILKYVLNKLLTKYMKRVPGYERKFWFSYTRNKLIIIIVNKCVRQYSRSIKV